jgi:uncharacterized membrane protein YidH (DUF202 family)
MKEDRDYIQDINEMRSMMERSSKFLSLSGAAGIMAGVYALLGAFVAYKIFGFNPDQIGNSRNELGITSSTLFKVIFLATGVLILALGTAVFLSGKKAAKRGEKIWNPTARRLIINISIPLITGGLLILVLISKGLIGLIAPFTLLFYGLALYTASKFTYEEVRSLGLIQIGLGLIGSYATEYGLILWALGFGVAHIIYGVYVHYRYER